MSLSTFSFNGSAGRRGRYSTEQACVALFVAVFASMTAVWLMFAESVPADFRPLSMDIAPPPSGEWYLGNVNAQVEQFAVYDNLDGTAEALKRADVLFVGDSLMLFAFQNQQLLQQYFSARGLRYYFLAFSGETDEAFAAQIIHKFDLHPKWVIVDAGVFFGRPPSAAATRAMSSGPMEAWQFRFEASNSLAIQRRIHRFYPYFGLSQWDNHPQWIWYRSRGDGTMSLAAWRGVPSAIRDAPFSDLLVLEAGNTTLRPGELGAAESFKNDLGARGARLVLTWIPPNTGVNAAHLATGLGVPLVTANATGLSTLDGQHLDRESSSRFSAAFLEGLADVPDFAQVKRTDY